MKLSDFELEVMQIMWERGPMTAPEVHEAVNETRAETKVVTYSTVKTIIDRLEKKAVVSRDRKYGRTILYKAVIGKETLSRPMVRTFIDKLFGGNIRPLFNHALQDENITLEDLAYLERVLAERKKELGPDHD